MIGIYHRYNPKDVELIAAALRIVDWARRRKVRIATAESVSFGHFPCGYGKGCVKDAGWTNDLSMFGTGLVWTYVLTGDSSVLDDAVGFAEYFVQPWRPEALGDDGYGTAAPGVTTWVPGSSVPCITPDLKARTSIGDEASWVFSTVTCTEYLTRLYRIKPDRGSRQCVRAANWTSTSASSRRSGRHVRPR